MERKEISYLLIVVGIIFMALPISGLVPMSVVSVGPVTISDISPYAAVSIGIGAIIFLSGLGVYLKK